MSCLKVWKCLFCYSHKYIPSVKTVGPNVKSKMNGCMLQSQYLNGVM